MDQRNDLLGALVFMLALAMVAQFGLDYVRGHRVEQNIANWAQHRSEIQ